MQRLKLIWRLIGIVKFGAVRRQRESELDFVENLESEISGPLGQVFLAFQAKTSAVCALYPVKRNRGDTGSGKVRGSFLSTQKCLNNKE